ncbi:MAG TPA: hypothetical protein VGC57_09660 [Cellulomonas sp.]
MSSEVSGPAADATEPGSEVPTPEERAERLKERVYVTFAALAVVLTMGSHVEEITTGEATTTLLITVGGTLLAVLVADVVSHMVVHAALPVGAELRHMLRVSVGSIGAIGVPLVFLGVAAVGAWPVASALRASTIALLATLGAFGWAAVRRVPLPGWQRLVLLLAEVALGAAVVGLELLAHR